MTVAVALALVGCARGTGEHTAIAPKTTTPEDTDSDTGPTSDVTPASVVCADPSDRTAMGAFTATSIPAPPAEFINLTEGGVVVADFDGDGLSDLFVAKLAPMLLLLNADRATFSDVSAVALPDEAIFLNIVGGAAADYDGDGDIDLYVALFGHPNVLLNNDGNGVFVDVTALAMPDRPCLDESTGLNIDCFSQSASWADMDLDGDLDLAVANYGDTPLDPLDPTMAPGGRKELYRNLGDGTFEDVSWMLPDSVHDGYGFHMIWVDVDEDGFPELWSVHDFGYVRASQLVDNIGGTLGPVDVTNGLDSPFEDMGVGVGDITGDGVPDFVTTSYVDISLRESNRSLGVTLNGVSYVDAADAHNLEVDPQQTGTKHQEFGWAAEVADVDNDSDLDVIATYGYWQTYVYSGRWESDALWINETGLFNQVGEDPFWAIDDNGAERGLVVADLNQDGWVDVVKGSLEGPTPVYLSRCGSENWLEVLPRLDSGMNRFAIGAKVVATTPDGQEQTRWVSAGSSSLYSSGPPEVHFGLADQGTATVTIRWPDQSLDVYDDVVASQRIELRPR